MENKCIICNSNNIRKFLKAKDYIYGIPGEFILLECLNCGLIFTYPRPSKEEIEKWYQRADYIPHQIQNNVNNKLSKLKLFIKKNKNVVIIKKILDTKAIWVPDLPKGANILELGCATGDFLLSLKDKGWNLYGVEVGKKVAQYAREKSGLNIYCGYLENLKLPSNMFDAIFAWHVIEHLPKPLITLSEIHRILKPEGYFIFSVPNIRSWEFKLFKQYWYDLQVPLHLSHFSPSSISYILDKPGFSIDKIFYQANINSAIGSLGIFFVNKGLISVGQFLIKITATPSLLKSLVLLPIAKIVAFLQKSGRITIIARKK